MQRLLCGGSTNRPYNAAMLLSELSAHGGFHMKHVTLIALLLVVAPAAAQEGYSPAGMIQVVNGQRYVTDGSGWLIREPATEALAEVNAKRAERGLPPLEYDDGLTQAAMAAAKFRADRLIDGHVDDFRFVPAGAHADAAGCAAWSPTLGWGSCCWDGNYRAAGAAWSMGADGRRFMHTFVRR